MPKTLYFITGNDYKLSIAQKAIAATPAIILERRKIECPEIQSHSNDDVAIFSARYAADFLQLPVVVSDAGFTIDALNGFPGPFIKYINDWLTPEDILAMMKDKTNRRATFIDVLAYAEPGQEPVLFREEASGTLTYVAKNISTAKNIGMINSIWIPDGFTKTTAEMSDEELLSLWSDKKWTDLAAYVLSKDIS